MMWSDDESAIADRVVMTDVKTKNAIHARVKVNDLGVALIAFTPLPNHPQCHGINCERTNCPLAINLLKYPIQLDSGF